MNRIKRYMKLVYNKMWIVGLIIITISILSACETSSSDVSVAKTTIRSFGSSEEGVPYKAGTVTFGAGYVAFDILVEPREAAIKFGDGYSVVLMSLDGYFIGQETVVWSKSDFTVPSSNERDINKITELNNKRFRRVLLAVSEKDKDINPMLQELEGLIDGRNKQAYADMDKLGGFGGARNMNEFFAKYALSESDYQKIASKYVRVIVIPFDDYYKQVTNQVSGQQ